MNEPPVVAAERPPVTAETPAPAAIAAVQRSSFAGDMMRLVSGTVFAQIISILATPIITRLFGPDAYGAAVAFGSIVSVIGVFLCLRYEQAIVLPTDDKQAANVLGLSLLSAAIVTAIVAAVMWFWSAPLLALVRMEELTPYMWMLAPALAVNAGLYVLTAWNGRKRQFGRIARGQMVNSLTTSGARIGSGLSGLNGSGAMIATNIFGSLVTVLFLAFFTLRSYASLFRQAIRPAGMAEMMRKYKDQPLFSTWASLLNTISWQLPVFMLTAFFSPAIAGQYALGQRIVRVPMSLVGTSISQVFYTRAATARVDGTLAGLTHSVFRRLVLFGIAPTLFLAIEGSNLFALVFGAQWGEAGLYVQILALWSFVWFISSPISQLQLVLEKQRFFLIWNSTNFASRFISLWVGAMLGNVVWALVLFGMSGVTLYGYLVLYLMHHAGVSLKVVIEDVFRQIVAYVPAIMFILIIQRFSLPIWLVVVTSMLVISTTFLFTARNEPALQDLLRRYIR
jgi:O-antigen/teichoic acid export membrane protein